MGFRLKDLPYVKSFLPTGVIAGILVVWLCVENGRGFRLKECLVLVWCLLLLIINGLVFDYRDIEGDSAAGTENNSGPVRTTEYDLFVNRVGASVGWGECLAGSGRVCESVNASDFSRRQCRITSYPSSPALSDDDQCLG